jgi:hypothetical protein
MLEETNDNLHDADGNLVSESMESKPTENVVIEDAITKEVISVDANTSADVADAILLWSMRIKSIKCN